jgi:hypothetical protein
MALRRVSGYARGSLYTIFLSKVLPHPSETPQYPKEIKKKRKKEEEKWDIPYN